MTIEGSLEFAWAAGFFDGEGCVLIRKTSKNGHSVRISVSQVNPAPIVAFKQLFGGHISQQKSRKPNWKSQWKWEQDSLGGVETLRKLLPYLVVKKGVAELAIEFQSHKKGKARLTENQISVQKEFKAKISDMNKRD